MSARRRFPGVLRAVLTLLVLAATLRLVGVRPIVERLRGLELRYLVLGGLLGLPQLLLAAARWRFTARALGVPLAYRRAVEEYGLSTFVNLSLPSGLAGDATRVFRHGQELTKHAGAPGLGAALRAALLERASGQLVVIASALAALPLWSAALRPVLHELAGVPLVLGACAGGALASTLVWPRSFTPATRATVQQLWSDARVALFSPNSWAPQLLLSCAHAATVLAQLGCALLALGNPLAATQAWRILPFVLLSMALPLQIAGFGAREAVSALLYRAAGLHAADGAAFSLGYGTLAWCSSLPGLCFFLMRRR